MVYSTVNNNIAIPKSWHEAFKAIDNSTCNRHTVLRDEHRSLNNGLSENYYGTARREIVGMEDL